MKQVPITKNFLLLSSPLHHSIYQRRALSQYCLVLLLASIALLAGSCQKSDNHKKTVPLKGEFVTSVMLIVPASPGVLEQIRVTGKGSGTPFGKATTEYNLKVDVTASPEIVSGIAAITAEDGDQIFATVSGYVSSPDAKGDFQVFNTHTITGGTGKYSGATGTYKETAKGHVESLLGTDTLDGTITY